MNSSQSETPPEARSVVQVDRGLGHSSAMLKALKTLPIHFQVRVKWEARFTTRYGKRHLIKNLIKPGELVTCRGMIFEGRKQVKVRLHLIWEVGQKEPWCLATNDPQIRGAVYALRMWQEESFRDLKSGGWQWHRTYVTSPEHAQRLLLVLTLAYAWMLTQGSFVLNGDVNIQREVFDGKHNKYSVFRSGLRWFKRMINVYSERIFVGLCPTFQTNTLKTVLPPACQLGN